MPQRLNKAGNSVPDKLAERFRPVLCNPHHKSVAAGRGIPVWADLRHRSLALEDDLLLTV
jgi:hypothetical protein